LNLLWQTDQTAPNGSNGRFRSVIGAEFQETTGDMISGGLVADKKTFRDLFIHQSHRHERQHLELPLAELLASNCLQQTLRDVGRDAPFVLVNHFDRPNDLLLRSVFENVTHCSCLKCPQDIFVGLVVCQHKDSYVWLNAPQLHDRIGAFHLRHTQIHEHNIGLKPAYFDQGLFGRFGRARYYNIFLAL
jgi:hypothetical protein